MSGAEFQLGENTYRADRMGVDESLDITLDLAPLLAGLLQSGTLKAASAETDKAQQFEAVAAAVLGAVGNLQKDKAKAIIYGLARHVHRKIPQGLGWTDVVIEASPGVFRLMHADINMLDLFVLAKHSFMVNLSAFTPALSRILPAGTLPQSAP